MITLLLYILLMPWLWLAQQSTQPNQVKTSQSQLGQASLLQRGVVISWLHHQLELELRLAQACTLHVLTQEVNHSRRLRLVFYGVANFAVAAQNGPVSLEIACSSSKAAFQHSPEPSVAFCYTTAAAIVPAAAAVVNSVLERRHVRRSVVLA